jgi:hypothetical protein
MVCYLFYTLRMCLKTKSERIRGNAVRGSTDQDRKFTALKVRTPSPLVLPVKVGWRQAQAVGCEEGGAIESGLLGRN